MNKLKLKNVSLYVKTADRPAYNSAKPEAYLPLEEVLNKYVVAPVDESYINNCNAVKAAYKKLTNKEVGEDTYKDAKANLPLICRFGGKFSGNTNNSLMDASGIVFIDIDAKDNKDLEIEAFRNKKFEQLKKFPYVLAAWKSASGVGFRILARIQEKNYTVAKQEEYYKQAYTNIAQEIQTNTKLITDKQCSNISRLVYMNYDNNAYINYNATTFTFTFNYTNSTLKTTATKAKKVVANSSNNGALVEHIIAACKENNSIQLCDNYSKWFAVACALKSEFGEEGFEYFVKLSSFDTNYKGEADCKNQWNKIKAKADKKYTFGTLIYMAKEAGVAFTGLESRVQHIILSDQLQQKYSFYKSEIDQLYYYAPNGEEEYKRFSFDEDFNTIKIELQTILGTSIKRETLTEQIVNNNTPVHNPIIKYLDSLQWDNKNRITDLLASIKTDNDELFKKMFIKWYMNMLHVLFVDRHCNDVCFILQGEQGTGKTWFFKELLPNYLNKYTEVAEEFNPSDKDQKHKLCSKLLIVLDELSGYSKADLNVLKSTISKTDYDLRLAYRADNSNYKRYSSLCGTTNDTTFLRDWTGDRRYAVFSMLEPLNGTLYNSIDKEQLLAQMYATYLKTDFNKVFKYTAEDRNGLIERNRDNYTVENEEQIILTQHLQPSNEELTFPEIKKQLKVNYEYDLKISNVMFGNIVKKLNIKTARKTINGTKYTVYNCTVSSGKDAVEAKKVIQRLEKDAETTLDDLFNMTNEEQLRSNFKSLK